MKQKGRCENCSRGAVLETIEVVRVNTTAPAIRLRLCKRCATVPYAVWRRHYRQVPQDAEQGESRNRTGLGLARDR